MPMAACASMADVDGTLGPAHARSLRPKARTLHTTSMDTDSLMHTITRRNSALNSTLLSIAARTHVIVMVAQTQHDELIPMVCCDGKSQNARLHALRAKSAPLERLPWPPSCTRARRTLRPIWVDMSTTAWMARFGMAATAHALQPVRTTPTASRPTEATPGLVGRHSRPPIISLISPL